MATNYGLEVFEILDNGDLLNAIYTDSSFIYEKGYIICNEIASKIKPDGKGIEGQYNCKFIEMSVAPVQHCTLTITKKGFAYKFEWNSDQRQFEGIGLMVGTNRIAVSYIEL
jgi:hypothetical protein